MSATAEIQSEALYRAQASESTANYAEIYRGLMLKGIPEADIKPRINVITLPAWNALGRRIRKGEHGVPVVTRVERDGKPDPLTGAPKAGKRFPKWRRVFHVSQTIEATNATRK